MFFQATEGWVGSNAEVMNRFGLPRLFDMNNFDKDTMPNFAPDMPQRTDLDVLSNAILRLSQAGMPIVADPETDAYLRSAIGLPDVSEAAGAELVDVYQQKLEQAATAPPAPVPPGETGEQDPNEQIKKMIAGALGRRMVRMGYRPDLAGSGPRRPVR
jgi:phage gp29-like protein